MNVNFGIMPPLDHRVRGGKRKKNAELAQRALDVLEPLRAAAEEGVVCG